MGECLLKCMYRPLFPLIKVNIKFNILQYRPVMLTYCKRKCIAQGHESVFKSTKRIIQHIQVQNSVSCKAAPSVYVCMHLCMCEYVRVCAPHSFPSAPESIKLTQTIYPSDSNIGRPMGMT